MRVRRRGSSTLLAVAMAVALVVPLIGSASGAPTTAKKKGKRLYKLTILHNNDGESQLIDLGGELTDFGGIARFATVVKNLRSHGNQGKRTGSIVVSSGDNFLAGPEWNASTERGNPILDAMALDLIGYDALAIGNHDFDFGPDRLADFINSFASDTPFLSANLDVSGEPALQALKDEGRIASSTVVKKDGRRIGIIGATTPLLAFISSPGNAVAQDMVAEAIQGEVDSLEDAGVNIIVLISHLQSIEEDLALAPEIDGVDIMVAGGGDEVLADDGDLLVPGDEEEIFGSYPLEATDMNGTKVPVITTKGGYAYVGKFAASFNRNGRLVKTHNAQSGPVRVAGGDQIDAVTANAQIQTWIVDVVIESIADLAANVIAQSEVVLDGRRSQVRTTETNEGNLIADALLWAGTERAAEFGVPEPDVALQNSGGIRNDAEIAAGDITELDTFDMVPFPNFVSIVEDVTPEMLRNLLENAVSNVENTDGRFAQVAGLEFTYDASGTPMVIEDGVITEPGTRVQEITLDDGTPIVTGGAVVPGAPNVSLATNDFSARGGDEYPFEGSPFTTLGVSYQQALVNYIVDGLSGLITSTDYPVGGEDRITRLN